MQLHSETYSDALLITVQETRIDAAAAIAFKDKMRELTDNEFARVVVDLESVDFVDSSGLGAIVGAMKQLGAGRKLELASLSPNVEKVFRLTRMDSVFTIHDTAMSAVEPNKLAG